MVGAEDEVARGHRAARDEGRRTRLAGRRRRHGRQLRREPLERRIHRHAGDRLERPLLELLLEVADRQLAPHQARQVELGADLGPPSFRIAIEAERVSPAELLPVDRAPDEQRGVRAHREADLAAQARGVVVPEVLVRRAGPKRDRHPRKRVRNRHRDDLDVVVVVRSDVEAQRGARPPDLAPHADLAAGEVVGDRPGRQDVRVVEEAALVQRVVGQATEDLSTPRDVEHAAHAEAGVHEALLGELLVGEALDVGVEADLVTAPVARAGQAPAQEAEQRALVLEALQRADPRIGQREDVGRVSDADVELGAEDELACAHALRPVARLTPLGDRDVAVADEVALLLRRRGPAHARADAARDRQGGPERAERRAAVQPRSVHPLDLHATTDQAAQDARQTSLAS